MRARWYAQAWRLSAALESQERGHRDFENADRTEAGPTGRKKRSPVASALGMTKSVFPRALKGATLSSKAMAQWHPPVSPLQGSFGFSRLPRAYATGLHFFRPFGPALVLQLPFQNGQDQQPTNSLFAVMNNPGKVQRGLESSTSSRTRLSRYVSIATWQMRPTIISAGSCPSRARTLT